MLEQLFWSLIHRPYVTAFMVFFLALALWEQGGIRTTIWVLSSYLIALLAEWGSINHGVPFGWYFYHYEALKQDLVVAGVPFFDTISFSFLSYVSFSFAQFFASPPKVGWLFVHRVSSPRARHAKSTLILGAFFMVVIDLVVDPIANLGEYWFLGKIYHYPDPGVHFGITFANYCGWFVVAMTTLWLNQGIDRALIQRGMAPPLRPYIPGDGLFSMLFWMGIVLFQLGVTYWVALGRAPGLDAERTLLQAVSGSYLLAPIFVLSFFQLARCAQRTAAQELG